MSQAEQAKKAVVRRLVAEVLNGGRMEAIDELYSPTGRRFERVDEVAIFSLRDGRITDAWSPEDTLSRLRQLGLIGALDAGGEP